MANKYLLVIHYAPQDLLMRVRNMRDQKAYANLGLIILTFHPEQYEEYRKYTDVPLRIVACDFHRGGAISEALKPFRQDIIGVICRGEKQIQYLRRTIPYLPPGVPFATIDSLAAATNKHLMRSEFQRYYPEITPSFLRIYDATEATLDKIEKELRYPIIIKPANLVSSLLIQSCHDRQALAEALKKLIDKSAEVYHREEFQEQPQFIVEEYLEGDFYSIDAYVMDSDEIYFCPPIGYVTAKQLGIDDFFLYKRFAPVMLAEQEVAAANTTVAKAVKALKLRHTSVHVELIRTHNGWKVIELGPRLGRFRHIMYDQVYAIDHSTNDIRIHIGKKPHIFTKPLRYCAAYSIFPEQEGTFREIQGLAIITKHPLVVYSKVMMQPGDTCRHAKHGGHAAAECIIASDSREAYEDAIRLIEEKVRVMID